MELDFMLPNIDTAPSSAIRSTMKLIEVVVYNVLNFCWLYPPFPCLITIPSGTQVTYVTYGIMVTLVASLDWFKMV